MRKGTTPSPSPIHPCPCWWLASPAHAFQPTLRVSLFRAAARLAVPSFVPPCRAVASRPQFSASRRKLPTARNTARFTVSAPRTPSARRRRVRPGRSRSPAPKRAGSVICAATNDLRLSRPRPSFAAMSKAEILTELPKLGCDERREIFERLCTLHEAEFSGVHQQWVDEALSSGPVQPASPSDWAGALQRGLARGAKHG